MGHKNYKRKTTKVNAARIKLVDIPPPPDYKISPIMVARNILQGRLRENGLSFVLDGKPANLRQVMEATNRVLLEREQPQITTNPLWMV